MRWTLTYDNEQLEDEYNGRPSEFEIRQAQRAAPDAWTRLYRMEGLRMVLVEERPPLLRKDEV